MKPCDTSSFSTFGGSVTFRLSPQVISKSLNNFSVRTSWHCTFSMFSYPFKYSIFSCGLVVDPLVRASGSGNSGTYGPYRYGTTDRVGFKFYETCQNELTRGPLSICIRLQLVQLVYLCHKNKGIFLHPWLNSPRELYIWLNQIISLSI